jgi:hypothetical protein
MLTESPVQQMREEGVAVSIWLTVTDNRLDSKAISEHYNYGEM